MESKINRACYAHVVALAKGAAQEKISLGEGDTLVPRFSPQKGARSVNFSGMGV